jgi:hypothetical protein
VRPERKLWEWLSGNVPLGQFSRIESGATCPGFADVDYILESGHQGVMELKAKDTRTEVPFKNQDDGIHKSQKRWIRERVRCGGRVFIIAQVDEYIYCLPGSYVAQFNGSTLRELTKHSLCILSKDKPVEAANELQKLLTGEYDGRL